MTGVSEDIVIQTGFICYHIFRMYDDYDLSDEMEFSPSKEDQMLYNIFYEAGRKLRKEEDAKIRIATQTKWEAYRAFARWICQKKSPEK